MKFCPQCGRDLDGEECSCGYKLGMTDEEYNELHKDELAVNPKEGIVAFKTSVPIGVLFGTSTKRTKLYVFP